MSRAVAVVLCASAVLPACTCGPQPGEGTGAPATAAPIVPIGPLPALKAPDPELVELGKMLFFDPKLSGDASLACVTCHDPAKGWGDGLALSLAYPGSKYFRNSKSLFNVGHAKYYYWDGRLSADDPETLVRDAITETHFMNMDGRLMLERLKQVPEYVKRFNATLGGEPSFNRTLTAVAAFMRTIGSRNVPFDSGNLSPEAARGRALFEGKAGCINCHSGPYFSDASPHAVGAPANPELTRDPERHFTLRSFSKYMGVPGFENLKDDPGYFIVSKLPKDRGRFVTPTLRELAHTAPYMHNGTLATLEDVVRFYDAGGGPIPDKDPLLPPLGLGDDEKADLVAFLKSLSGDAPVVDPPAVPAYAVMENWNAIPN